MVFISGYAIVFICSIVCLFTVSLWIFYHYVNWNFDWCLCGMDVLAIRALQPRQPVFECEVSR